MSIVNIYTHYYIYIIVKKFVLDFKLNAVEHLHERYVLLKATNPQGSLPEMCPGQFAQLLVPDAPNTFLRRPISIHYVCPELNEVWFLVQTVGDGTKRLARLHEGDMLNVVLPLGNGFTLPVSPESRVLLVGGGVGVAPLLYMGRVMADRGVKPTFLLGARSSADLLQLDMYRQFGDVYLTTEDGSMGEKGFVTQHSLLSKERFTQICVCGPLPMMKAVARYAKSVDTPCEVSLENMMACGLGACLCCVEDTNEGHVCVCTEGPVFNIERLKWQI